MFRSLVTVTIPLALAACASTPAPPSPAASPQARPPQAQAHPPRQAQARQVQKPPATAPRARRVRIRPDAPRHYVVKKGDNLWDIAAKFLKDPWHWPEIWYLNPHIHNPHLIYPGDVLTLTYTASGRPRLQLSRGPGAPRTVRIKPKVRVEPLGQAIPTIPYDAVAQFLAEPRVLDRDALDSAPYVLRAVNGAQLVVGASQRVYVRGLPSKPRSRYQIVHKGPALRDPKTGKLLGYEAIAVGEARILKGSDPGIAMVEKANREVRAGDRLLPPPASNFRPYFTPRPPAKKLHGQILSVYDGLSEIGQYQIVTIDLGKSDGLKVGNVLGIYQRGSRTRDPVTGADVQLPPQRAGILMAFRIYRHVSYALVMRATRSIHVLDVVHNP